MNLIALGGGSIKRFLPPSKTLLIMKLVFGFLFACSLQATAHVHAQNVSIKGKNLAIEKVFNSITSQTGFSFWYDYDLLKQANPVTIDLHSIPLTEALDRVVQNQPFSYSIQDKVIVLRRKENAAWPQNMTVRDAGPASVIITGHVANENGEPLAGALIQLKSAKINTVADENGNFQLELDNIDFINGSLQISFVGYNTSTIRLNGRNNLQIIMQKKVQELDNVVITNFYSKPKLKEELTGSVSTLSGRELQTYRPIESFDKMLEGLIPGMQVQTNTELGTPVKVNIRGQNSLTNLYNSNQTQLTTSSQPLYIVDGVPVTEQRRGDEPIAFLNNEQLLNPLAGINPNDIASISVLKDAAAAAIYGANASNGVILITTKKGIAGKTSFDVGYSAGWSGPINQVEWLSGSDYHDLVRELYLNGGRDPYTAEVLAGPDDINTPWYELTNQYGQYNTVDMNLSGGNATTQFRISAIYQDQQSIQKGNDYTKMAFRMRLDHAISKKLHLTASMAPTIINKNALNIYSNVPIVPNVPAYNADGSFYELSNLGVPNPLAVLAQNTDKHSGGTLNGNVRLDYQITRQLSISSSIGIDALLNKENIFQSGENATGRTKNGFAQIYDRTNFSWINYNQINWTPSLKKGHKLDLLLGFEAQSQQSKLLRGEGSGFSYYRLNELSNAQNQSSASSRQVSNSYSVYGQASYGYKERYFLSAAGRYDAASIFGPDINSTVNAALGLGWNISKEKWFGNSSFVDLLHLRGSYGTTGNSRIGSYQAKGIYTFNSQGYNGMTSSSPSTAPNPNLSWEKSYKLDFGLDFNFLKHFSLTIDFYQNILDDAISTIQVPIENGFSTILANVGKMRNRGVDGGFEVRLTKGSFRWTGRITAGYNKNMVLSVKNNSYRYSQAVTASVLRAGVSTSAIWGFQYAGVDPQSGLGLYYDKSGKLVDQLNLDRSMTNAYYLGDRLPDMQGGLINSFSYKSLTLTINLLYSFGGKDLIDYNLEANGNNLSNRNQSVNLLDRWHQEGQAALLPKLSTALPIVNSSQYLYDASYLKLNNVSLSYALPAKWIKRLGGIRGSVFVNGTNLAYWYKEKSPAGRNGYREYRFNGFPESQTISWGARIGI